MTNDLDHMRLYTLHTFELSQKKKCPHKWTFKNGINLSGKLYRQDEELAKLEEETARKLQDRMAAELEDLKAEDLIPQVRRYPSRGA